MKTLRVALADDEPLARARLARLLREAGCDVKAELADGSAVLEWLREPKEVEALFLDITHDVNPRAMSPKVKGFVQAKNWFQDFSPIYMQ